MTKFANRRNSEKAMAFWKVVKVVDLLFFSCLGIILVGMYILAMSSFWLFEDTNVPKKIHYTIWMAVIVSFAFPWQCRKIRDYFKRKRTSRLTE